MSRFKEEQNIREEKQSWRIYVVLQACHHYSLLPQLLYVSCYTWRLEPQAGSVASRVPQAYRSPSLSCHESMVVQPVDTQDVAVSKYLSVPISLTFVNDDGTFASYDKYRCGWIGFGGRNKTLMWIGNGKRPCSIVRHHARWTIIRSQKSFFF